MTLKEILKSMQVLLESLPKLKGIEDKDLQAFQKLVKLHFEVAFYLEQQRIRIYQNLKTVTKGTLVKELEVMENFINSLKEEYNGS